MLQKVAIDYSCDCGKNYKEGCEGSHRRKRINLFSTNIIILLKPLN